MLIFISHALCASHRERYFLKIIQSDRASNSYMYQIFLCYHILKKDWRDQAATFSVWSWSIWSWDILKERSSFNQLNSSLEILSATVCNNKLAETEKKETERYWGLFWFEAIFFFKDISQYLVTSSGQSYICSSARWKSVFCTHSQERLQCNVIELWPFA